MTEPIDAIRSIRRESLPFERVMSGLTVAIGDVERLPALDPGQLDRAPSGRHPSEQCREEQEP